MFEMYVEVTVRGYHAYLDSVSVRIGEILTCERELDNPHDKYAVAVKTQDGKLVGHVPKELSRLFHNDSVVADDNNISKIQRITLSSTRKNAF